MHFVIYVGFVLINVEAAWAAIFAVSTALAGIWGMNFERMPELKWAYGYPMALGIIAAAGGLLYWRFRRAGWL